jgi:diaminopimelate epimerase
VKFANSLGIHRSTYHFIASDGEHEASFDDNDWVNLKMKDVDTIQERFADYILNTGSPHYVRIVNDIKDFDVVKEGKEVRYSRNYSSEGINVNFVQTTDKGIYVRTYERGVEDETLSCGTGVTASALVFAHNDRGFNRVEVQTPGGNLAVEFDKLDEDHFTNIWLCGPAQFVFKGFIEV